MRTRYGALVTVVLLVPLAATSLFAQVDRAVLEGTVTDQTGTTIVGVSVVTLADSGSRLVADRHGADEDD